MCQIQGVIIIYVSLMKKLRCDCLTPLPEITQQTDDETYLQGFCVLGLYLIVSALKMEGKGDLL